MVYFGLITLSGLLFLSIFSMLPNAGIPLLGSFVLIAIGVYGLWEESRQ